VSRLHERDVSRVRPIPDATPPRRATVHPRRLRTVLAVVLLLSAGCGPSAPVEPEVAPASVPVPLEVAPASQTQAPHEDEDEDVGAEPVEEVADVDRTPAPAAPSSPAPSPTPTPAPRPTATPTTPTPPPPDLVVGEDGCVTDLTTGLVVTCHDDAAGPDDAEAG
jgi:hypothetical protein